MKKESVNATRYGNGALASFVRLLSLFATLVATPSFISCASSTGASALPSTDYPIDGPWELVFEDDFDGTALDSETWTALERGENWNNEDQAYTPANASVADGFLVLSSRRESWTGPVNSSGHPDEALGPVTRAYTSAQGQTKGKRSWLYGKFECRAKVGPTTGTLDAIWMCAEDGSWPPEIDIAEILGGERHALHMTNHYGTASDHRMNSGSFTADVDLAADYRVYSVEWEPSEIRWYLDGVLRYSTRSGVPAKPFYFIICPAIGPDWTGDPDETSEFPSALTVDWVRVWQRK